MIRPRLLAATIVGGVLAAGYAAPVGVNFNLPSKVTNPKPERVAAHALVASLPKGTPVRIDLLFHETEWDKKIPYGGENIRDKLAFVAPVKGVIVLVMTPLPWPGSWGWKTEGPWGYVAPADIPALARRFAREIEFVRRYAKELGIPERKIRIQIGNEPAAGHPGGWANLPPGTWWDRHGDLYVACLRASKFGEMKVIAPALSMLDHAEPDRSRELETATPILTRLKPFLTYADVHHRLYAPQLSTREYAAEWLRLLRERLKLAAQLTGRPAVCTEAYLFREDRGATDDRAELLSILRPKLPAGVYFYRVGPGGSDRTTELEIHNLYGAM